MNIQQHIKILGATLIAFHALMELLGLILLVVVVGWEFHSGNEEAAVLGVILAFFSLLFIAPGIIGGIGLLKRKSWSRLLVLILSCLNLFSIPFGTAIGIYGLWVLTRPEAQQILTR